MLNSMKLGNRKLLIDECKKRQHASLIGLHSGPGQTQECAYTKEVPYLYNDCFWTFHLYQDAFTTANNMDVLALVKLKQQFQQDMNTCFTRTLPG